MQQSTFKRAPHPLYSPDIAPSDFFLFGYVKGQLQDRVFKQRGELYVLKHFGWSPYSLNSSQLSQRVSRSKELL